MISVIVPVHNGSTFLVRCLGAIAASRGVTFECILVDDSSSDDSVGIAGQFPFSVVQLTGGPYGPAYARNRGAEMASGEILFFVDADVVVQPDTVSRIAEVFERDAGVDALFGSYDEAPFVQDFISQYKNLFHHYVHQQGHAEAATFWSGCGAIRRAVFLAMHGFDEKRFPHPCIEDIELGSRLVAGGHRILLRKEIQVKHLKRWELGGLLRSDVLDRAIPWTRLILEQRSLPNDLNLRLSQRMSSALTCLLIGGAVVMAAFYPMHLVGLLVAALFLILVGRWDWSADSRSVYHRLNWAQLVIALACLGAIVGVAWSLGHVLLLLPLIGVLACVMVGYLDLGRGHLAARICFDITVLATVTQMVLLLAVLSLPLVVAITAILAAIIMLNRNFYHFFVQRRGVIFALGVIPFHLLYYMYSALALVIGTGLHLWSRHTFRAGTFRPGETSTP